MPWRDITCTFFQVSFCKMYTYKMNHLKLSSYLSPSSPVIYLVSIYFPCKPLIIYLVSLSYTTLLIYISNPWLISLFLYTPRIPALYPSSHVPLVSLPYVPLRIYTSKSCLISLLSYTSRIPAFCPFSNIPLEFLPYAPLLIYPSNPCLMSLLSYSPRLPAFFK
jgi:hypothetical protein